MRAHWGAAGQSGIAGPARIARRHFCAARARTTGRAGSPLMRFCSPTTVVGCVALSECSHAHWTIPLRPFRTRWFPAAAPRRLPCFVQAALQRGARVRRSLRFFADVCAVVYSRRVRRADLDRSISFPEGSSPCVAHTCQSHVTVAGRRVMHRQFLRGDVPLPARIAASRSLAASFSCGAAHGVCPSQFCSCPQAA